MLQKIKTYLLLNLLIILSVKPLLAQEKQLSNLEFGGALRMNYNYSNWLEDSKKESGEFVYDVFILKTKGTYNKILFDAEYRFYPKSSGGGMLKHAWIGYDFNPNSQLHIGLNQVPFGILPYQSNNYFFSINYYLGKEDDSDMGIKFIYNKDNWRLHLAFYKNSDIIDAHSDKGINSSRYAYDISGRNKEINQGNLRLARYWGNSDVEHELGFSAELGGVYNLDTKKTGDHNAFAIHYKAKINRLSIIAQAMTYDINPKNAEFISIANDNGDNELVLNPEKNAGYVEMSAYGSTYRVANKANTYILGVSYEILSNKGILDNLTVYNDFGMMHKRTAGMEDSFQNVTGVRFSMGPIFAYLDYAMGNNQAWLGPEWTNAFASGGEGGKWSARLNLNIGYYF